MKGRLPTFESKSYKDMKMESRDCSLPLDSGAFSDEYEQSEEDRLIEDEILREIMEEEAAR